jgi:anti-sigma-K factor RskA
MKLPPPVRRLVVLVPVLLMALGAAAGYVQQLRSQPVDLTVERLVQDGYQITGSATMPAASGDGSLVTVTTTLQRGQSVVECYELKAARADGSFAAQYHHCAPPAV